jgi:predicted PurR-regulated permease PerM
LARSNNSAAASTSSTFIAVAVAIAMLYFGRQILIPIALAVVLSFVLTPFVSLLEKCRIGRFPSVLLVLALCFSLLGVVGWAGAGQLFDITVHLRDYKANIEGKIHALHSSSNGPLSQATSSVQELNKELATAPAVHSTKPVPVQITAPPTSLVQDARNFIGPLAGSLEIAVIVVVFTAFMLCKREDLRNRLIRLAGHGQLNRMTQALDDASHRLSRYLLLQFLVNAGFGMVFGAGLYFIGVPNALLWGTLATLLRFVPYIGTLIATAGPVALALAVFPGWHQAWMTLGVFAILELVVANAIEPLLYASHTGISSLAILVAAVFWATLWGPVGLILSTPLTVCLLLLGRYVPQLKFLEVALGDEPVLRPEEKFYQRLLAMDQLEARTIAEGNLEDKRLDRLYDSVLIPALRLAEEDRHRDSLEDHTSEFIFQSTRELIEDFGERIIRRDSTQPEVTGVGPRIICLAASDEADELAAIMLVQLLQLAGSTTSYLATGTPDQLLEQVAQRDCQVACVSALPPVTSGHARALCKQLRAKFPQLTIILGLWQPPGEDTKSEVGQTCANVVCTTLTDAVKQAGMVLGPDAVEESAKVSISAPSPEESTAGVH